jgi:hypothetical protein
MPSPSLDRCRSPVHTRRRAGVPVKDSVRGFVFDVATGALREVPPA